MTDRPAPGAKDGHHHHNTEATTMKYVIEFGVRGGAHVDNFVVPTQKLAKELAHHLVMVFTNDHHCDQFRDYAKGRRIMRASWTSSTHFVSVSPLDGTMRGPASNDLWKPEQ